MRIVRTVKELCRIFSVNYALCKTGEKALLEKHLVSLPDKSSRSLFKEASSVFTAGTLEEKRMCYSMTEDIIQKMEMCSDKKVKESAGKIMQEAQGKSNQEIYNAMNKAETLLDSVNVAENKYCPLFDAASPMGNVGKDKISLKAKAGLLDDAIKSGDEKRAERVAEDLYSHYSQPRQIYYALKRSGRVDEVLSSKFDLSSRYSRMREYILNCPEDEKMADYLYDKYFLNEMKTINPDFMEEDRKEMIALLKMINKKYNTKVFLDNVDNYVKFGLEDLKDEFNIWAKISGKRARYPLVYESSEYCRPRITNGFAAGNACYDLKRISVEDINCSRERKGLHINRHEMVHLNDKHRTDKGSYEPITIPEHQKSEMEKAGISKEDIEYGETNIHEKRAVILEGDLNSYSQGFKDEVVNVDKVEPYMLELCSHSEFFERALRKKYSSAYEARIIDRIKKAFGDDYNGEMPTEVSKALLKNKAMLTVARDVIKAQNGKKFDFAYDFIYECEEMLEKNAEEILEMKKKFWRQRYKKQLKAEGKLLTEPQFISKRAEAQSRKLLADCERLHKETQQWLDSVKEMRACENAQPIGSKKSIFDILMETQNSVSAKNSI